MLYKLIYSTYLIHVIFIAVHIDNFSTLPYFSHYELVRGSFKRTSSVIKAVFSFVVGSLSVLAFEYPGINIHQVVFNTRKNEKEFQEENPAIQNFGNERS